MADDDHTQDRSVAGRGPVLADLFRGDPEAGRSGDPLAGRPRSGSKSIGSPSSRSIYGNPCEYDVVVDRLTHWYHTSREWIKKAVLMDDLYVFNNPWSLQSMEKHTAYCAMMRLGLPVPDTVMVPPQEYEPSPDLTPTLERYARLFDLEESAEKLGYPMFMKPYDGGAWVGVSKLDSVGQLHNRVRAERQAGHAPAEGGGAVRSLRAQCGGGAAGPQYPLRPGGAAPRALSGGLRFPGWRGEPGCSRT